MGIFYHIARFIVEPLHVVFFPKKVVGYREKRCNEPTVVVCNHISMWDAVITATCYKDKSFYLCKKEAFNNKFIGKILKSVGGIKIDRENPDFNEIKNTLKLLKDGNRVAIFPEGTRNKSGDGNLLPIKGGAGMFAFKAKAKVIPMYINKKTKFLRRNYVYIGEPFTFEEFYGQRFSQELSDALNKKIEDKIYECKANLEQYLLDKKSKKKKKNKDN